MQYKKWQMKGHIAYRGFQKPKNQRLAGGVEPLCTAALLTPADGVRDGPETAVTTPLSVFFAASSESFLSPPLRWSSSSPPPLQQPSSSQLPPWWPSSLPPPPRQHSSKPPLRWPSFFLPPPSAASFAATVSIASFAAVALVATVVLPTAELPLDPLGTVARATVDEAGLGVRAAGGGLPAVDLPRS
jgi:hypothetical protein